MCFTKGNELQWESVSLACTCFSSLPCDVDLFSSILYFLVNPYPIMATCTVLINPITTYILGRPCMGELQLSGRRCCWHWSFSTPPQACWVQRQHQRLLDDGIGGVRGRKRHITAGVRVHCESSCDVKSDEGTSFGLIIFRAFFHFWLS